jgi:hypothetical protein
MAAVSLKLSPTPTAAPAPVVWRGQTLQQLQPLFRPQIAPLIAKPAIVYDGKTMEELQERFNPRIGSLLKPAPMLSESVFDKLGSTKLPWLELFQRFRVAAAVAEIDKRPTFVLRHILQIGQLHGPCMRKVGEIMKFQETDSEAEPEYALNVLGVIWINGDAANKRKVQIAIAVAEDCMAQFFATSPSLTPAQRKAIWDSFQTRIDEWNAAAQKRKILRQLLANWIPGASSAQFLLAIEAADYAHERCIRAAFLRLPYPFLLRVKANGVYHIAPRSQIPAILWENQEIRLLMDAMKMHQQTLAAPASSQDQKTSAEQALKTINATLEEMKSCVLAEFSEEYLWLQEHVLADLWDQGYPPPANLTIPEDIMAGIAAHRAETAAKKAAEEAKKENQAAATVDIKTTQFVSEFGRAIVPKALIGDNDQERRVKPAPPPPEPAAEKMDTDIPAFSNMEFGGSTRPQTTSYGFRPKPRSDLRCRFRFRQGREHWRNANDPPSPFGQ